jgi:hypothetical protein
MTARLQLDCIGPEGHASQSRTGCVEALEASPGTEGFSKVFGVLHFDVVNVSIIKRRGK